MSVATHSPLCGNKRLFGEAGNSPDYRPLDEPWPVSSAAVASGFAQHGWKRVRRSGNPRYSGDGRNLATSFLFPAAGAAALQHLLELFPRMDQQIISSVLIECGSNIDAAIKRLGELQLEQDTDEPPEDAAAAPSACAVQQAAPEQARPGSAASVESADSPEVRSAEEWVQIIVSEMSAASDFEDAKARAARVFQSFEAQVQMAEKQAISGEMAALSAQMAELARGNTILKKAVQIQNARMHELADKDTQLASLQQALVQHQEKIRILELSNYSLSLHLRQAGSAPMPQHRHPDVF